MNVTVALLAGLVGTVAMTMLMLVAPRMGMPKMDMLGTMVTPTGGAAQAVVGILMGHLVFGLVVAWVYGALA